MKAPGYRTIRHGEASIASKILGPEHPTNEDSFASVLDISEELLGEGSPADSIAPLSSFFVVSDGHAGNGVSRMVRDELPKAFALSESFNSLDMPVADSLAGALVGGLKELETKIWDQAARGDPDSSGACLVAVALRGSHLCVANLGDCQALLLPPNGAPVELTKIHRSNAREEKARIREAGAKVTEGRISGILEPSRSLGDLDIKRCWPGAISIFPHISLRHLRFGQGQKYMIVMATDGVWDFVRKTKVVEVVTENQDPQEAVDKLTRMAVENGSTDDVTAIIVHLS